MKVHIVTDSGAHFTDARLLKQYPITVVPNKVTVGARAYQPGVDISSEEMLNLIAQSSTPPALTPPSASDFLHAYTQASADCDAIISIHTSREISSSWGNGRRAAQQMGGPCPVAIVDSQSICVGQGMLVRLAAQAAQTATDFDALVRQVRGAVERIYALYYVETLDLLLHNQIINPSHGILGAMLGIKPFVSIESGQLTLIEKVRNRIQAIERLVEFVIEFDEIEEAVIVQPRSAINEQTRMLQERLTVEFPGRAFAHSLYGPALATLIGSDASGVIILERAADGLRSRAHAFDDDDDDDDDSDDDSLIRDDDDSEED